MWTVRGPWRFGPRPPKDGVPDPTNITALEYLYSYGDQPTVSPRITGLNAEQKAMLATYRAPGNTHCCFGPINAQSYHGQYPDYDFMTPPMFEVWLDWLQVFWTNGIAPTCFLHPDGWTFEQTKALYDPLIRNNPRAKRLMRIVVPSGWEPAGYDWSSKTWALYFQWIRELLPDALVLMHNAVKEDGSPYDAPVGSDALWNDDDNPNGNGDGWARVAPYLHGWLIQDGAYGIAPTDDPTLANNFAGQFDPGSLGASTHGFAWHFINGIGDWPRGSAWGSNTPIKLYNAECTSYEAYWHNLSTSVSEAWGDLAMAHGADGYMDSGTVNVGGDTPPPWVRP